MALFERGQLLMKHCAELLEAAELKVQQLVGGRVDAVRGGAMNLAGLLENKILIGTLAAWLIAQGLKAPMEYLRTHEWKWRMTLSAGGMPSSHSALLVGATLQHWSVCRI